MTSRAMPSTRKPCGAWCTWHGAVSNLRRVGSVALWAGVIGSFLYWLRTGRHRTPPEEVAVAEATERESAPTEATGQIDVAASKDLS